MNTELNSSKRKNFIIDSHRGVFKGGILENSTPAFMESLKEGANVVECDVRKTKDNKLVLIHNKTIDHIVKFAEKIPDENEFGELPSGLVKEHTLAYLKALKFPNDAEILTLEEFFETLKKTKLGAQIELKEMGFEDQILKIAEEANVDYSNQIGPIVITSFNWLSILKLIKKSKQYNIQLFSRQQKGDSFIETPGLCFGLQAIPLGTFYGNWVLKKCYQKGIWGFMTYYKYLPIEKLSIAHKYGVKFCPRVPNDRDLIMKYIKAGVDGFETDDISFIIKCIQDSNNLN